MNKRNLIYIVIIFILYICYYLIDKNELFKLNKITENKQYKNVEKNERLKFTGKIRGQEKRRLRVNIEEQEILVRGSNSLVEAFKHLKSGDTLILSSGVYVFDENLKISNLDGIKIIGNGAILVQEDLIKNVLTIDNCSNIEIHNIHLTHEINEYHCRGDVIYTSNSNNVHIENAILNGCGDVGLHSHDSTDITINNSEVFHNYSRAVDVTNSNLSITNSIFYENTRNSVYFNKKEIVPKIGQVIDIEVDGNFLYMKNNEFKDPEY